MMLTCFSSLTRTPLLIAVAMLWAMSASLGAEPAEYDNDGAWQAAQPLALELDALGAALQAAATADDTSALAQAIRDERTLNARLDEAARKKGAVETTQQLDAVVELLTRQSRRLREHLEMLERQIVRLRGERDATEPAQALELEYRIGDLLELQGGLIDDLVTLAARVGAIGGDANGENAAIDVLLRARGALLARQFQAALERIERLEKRLKAAPEEGKSAIAAELAALAERREQLERALDASIEIMNQRGIDTSALSQLMFRATGQISGNIFDREVLAGLLGEWMDRLRAQLLDDGPAWLFKLAVFVAVLIVARILANIAGRAVTRAVTAPNIAFSQLLQEFSVKVASNLVLGLGILIALSQIGVELAPLLAGLGVAGFILGFALQETLSNFASGLMILIYRPFDIGDVVEAGGVSGKVMQMSLVSTTINTFDNQKLVVPNNKIWGDVIRNVNAEPTRRVDMGFGIGYGDDIAHAASVLREIVGAHELVLKDPEPVIRLHTLGESSVDFIVRPWVRSADYWTVYWEVTSAVKERFDAEGISIPFPQRDLHIYRQHSA